MANPDLQQVGRMMKENKTFEERHGYKRLIDNSRLPQLIRVRRGFKIYKYKLNYGDIDDRVYLSYSDDSVTYKQKHKALMHYEETTLKECISKAWRNFAENGIHVKGPVV